MSCRISYHVISYIILLYYATQERCNVCTNYEIVTLSSCHCNINPVLSLRTTHIKWKTWNSFFDSIVIASYIQCTRMFRPDTFMPTLYGEKLRVIVENLSLPETCRDFPDTHIMYKAHKYDFVPLHCCYTKNPHSKKKVFGCNCYCSCPPSR